MSYDHAPYQGFGDPDDPDRFSVFHVEVDDDGTYPDWEQELLESTRQYAVSSSYVTQITGFGPSRVTLRLWFDTRRDFDRLYAQYGTVGTLSLLAGLSNQRGPIRTWTGRDYEQYRDTLLLQISRIRPGVDGTVRCEATFQRAYDPRVTP